MEQFRKVHWQEGARNRESGRVLQNWEDWKPQQILAPARLSHGLGAAICFRIPDSTGVPWILCLSPEPSDSGSVRKHYLVNERAMFAALRRKPVSVSA
jgi:hypothetical protein